MERRGRGRILTILCAFLGMLMLLGILLWQGIRRGSAVRVGIPNMPSAWGAVVLLQTPSAQYSCTLGSMPQVLLTALNSGDLDAALLPPDLAARAEGCRVCGVLGGEPLVVLYRGGKVKKLKALEGADLAFSEEAENSRAGEMLKSLIRKNGIRCSGEKNTQAYACMIGEAQDLLASGEGWQEGFAVSEEWRRRESDPWPEGLCLTVREEYLGDAGSDFAAFTRALDNSVRYAADKRKKTVAMLAAAGLAKSAGEADALYPLMDFYYIPAASASSGV
ncbi:MAG: hypothetical protein J5564_00275 [Clostridia bacterium]|nr:hypothetical protein [Clostridia bacterium]